MIVCDALFGNSEFSLRIPNVLAFPVYSYFSYRACCHFTKDYTALFYFIILTSNLFLVDFFTVARGYGLAIAFLMAGLFYLLEYAETKIVRSKQISVTMGILAVLSNYSFLYFFVPQLLVLVFIDFTSSKQNILSFIWDWMRNNLLIIAALVPLLLAVGFVLKRLQSLKMLWAGGTEGFFQNTVYSLVKFSFLGYSDTAYYYIALLVSSILVAVVAFYLVTYYKNRIISPALLICILFIAAFILQQFNFFVLNSKYLENRTAAIYLPLFLLIIISFLNIRFSDFINRLKPFVSGIIVGFALVYGVLKANPYCSVYYDRECEIRNTLTDLKELYKGEKISIACSDYYFPFVVNYYVIFRNYDWIAPTPFYPYTNKDIPQEIEIYRKMYPAGRIRYMIYESEAWEFMNEKFGKQRIIKHYKLSDTILTKLVE